MTRPTLPDTASAGDTGHVADHNTIVAGIQAAWDELDALRPIGRLWPPGGLASTAVTAGGGGVGSGAANTAYYQPWWCPVSGTLDQHSVEVTTGSAGANARLGVYDLDATTGGPGALIVDCGEIDCATNGVKSLTVSQALTGGRLYWLAMLNESASVAYRYGTGMAIGAVSSTAQYGGVGYLTAARTYTDGLPATAPALGSLTFMQFNPWIHWLRRTS